MNINSAHLTHPKYRPDIDGLRAIAILAVVIFHAFPDWVRGGFIGVDIFFVISGFLISTIILENLARDTFSFTEFYARRVKRIFPALMIVLISCLAFGWYSLLPDEYAQLGKHVAAGAGFVSNFALWGESGYFDNAAESKPLLHLWSLGIEEQFYLAWPLMLWVAWKKKINALTIILAFIAISFALNILYTHKDVTAAFYFPHTRFWELLCGSLLAWHALNKQTTLAKLTKNQSNALSIIGLTLLGLGISSITKASAFPGWWAVLPVSGAMLIILAGMQAWVNRVILSSRVMVWFGLISYPLYLWHWPLLSFARIMKSGILSRIQCLLLVLLSILLAWLTYRLIERNVRYGQYASRKVAALSGIALVLIALGLVTVRDKGFAQRMDISPGFTEVAFKEYPHFPLHNEKCDERYPQFKDFSSCLLSKQRAPDIAIIGDSHSQQYYKSAARLLGNESVINIGEWRCLPFSSRSFLAADSCAERIDLTLDFLKNEPSIKTVYLAGYYSYLMSGGFRTDSGQRQARALDLADEESFKQKATEVLSALERTGKRIIVMEDIPDMAFNPRNCATITFNSPDTIFEARFGSTASASSSCKMDRQEYESRIKPYDDVLKSVLEKFNRVQLYKTRHVFCNSNYCEAIKGDRLLYYNSDHLTIAGSDLVVQNLPDSPLDQ